MKTDWMTREQYDWWLDNVAAPDAPLRWFARFQAKGPVAWALAVVKYLALYLGVGVHLGLVHALTLLFLTKAWAWRPGRAPAAAAGTRQTRLAISIPLQSYATPSPAVRPC
jgi:hypothetical protein